VSCGVARILVVFSHELARLIVPKYSRAGNAFYRL
jgi:hypothetical protein